MNRKKNGRKNGGRKSRVIGTGIFAGFLAVSAIQDLRRKKVARWIYLFFGVLSLIWAGNRFIKAQETYVILDHLAAVVIGMGILFVGVWSEGAVGAGDGWFFCITGVILGFWENVMLLLYGTLLCGLFSLGYFFWGKIHGIEGVGKRTIPFLPFVAVPGVWLIAERIFL